MFGRSSSSPQQDLIVHNTSPLNAEPPLNRLRSAFVTKVEYFYIRSHGDLPEIDANQHTVSVSGLVGAPLELTLADLKARFEHKTVMAVMQCAGNRRADMQQIEKTSGDPWGPGAIGNAEWTGVSLADVLRAAGASDNETLHVAFEALDIAENEGATNAPYGASIPMSKALASDVLLAWAMNGDPLTREHGAPLRVVVPGYAGVRSPKWLVKIKVQDKPSDAFQQAQDYLLFPPDVRKDTQDLSRGTAVYEMPLNAAICEPAPGAVLAYGKTAIRGYATATDRAIIRVDVSTNGGRQWHQATIEDHANKRWSWTFWHVLLEIPAGRHELVVRAWDSAGQTQPALVDDTWNFKGYLSAAWHRVQVNVE